MKNSFKELQGFNSIGLLANQTSYYFSENKYLIELLGKKLKVVFVPEHGFFSELQDQVTLDNTSDYQRLNPGAEFVSVYGSNKHHSLRFPPFKLLDTDCIVIDIQDIGVRYFTYITSIFYLFETLKINKIDIPVFVVDRPNPNIGKIEGTPLQEVYQSFIGVAGLPHCYGLSLFEVTKWLKEKTKNKNELFKISFSEKNWIQPSPNIPSPETCRIYTGMCLVEGTTMSEGRGTTLPFQIFGSPDLRFEDLEIIRKNIEKTSSKMTELNDSWALRPLKFIPTFHKHANKICNGFQIHVTNPIFHSLLFGLILLKETSRFMEPEKLWRKGAYEFGNDKTAIELLVGDKFLLDYLFEDISTIDLYEYIQQAEKGWMS
ncbi:MAG: DUF1343 domain-containing protein [Bacteroidetes bacterium]|nr:DUF1343 domain-containing protein [Bacteroidota bacterium]